MGSFVCRRSRFTYESAGRGYAGDEVIASAIRCKAILWYLRRWLTRVDGSTAYVSPMLTKIETAQIAANRNVISGSSPKSAFLDPIDIELGDPRIVFRAYLPTARRPAQRGRNKFANIQTWPSRR